MKLQTHFNILLQGKPSPTVEVLPEPEVLYLPLRTRRFTFSHICVAENQPVQPGQVLARDLDNHSLPLLAPRAGTAQPNMSDNHIVLQDITPQKQEPYDPRQDEEHVAKDINSVDAQRDKLLMLGAWQFFYDAHTQSLPAPAATPHAVIVSTIQLEPFAGRGDVQISNNLSSFTRGLEHLQSLLEYQPIYLVMPQYHSELADRVHEAIRGYAWAKIIKVPLRYPRDNFALLARSLGLQRRPDSPVWALRTEAVLAIDRALTFSLPCTNRIVSLAGPAVRTPIHLQLTPGYPLKEILQGRIHTGPTRIIDGGVLTGRTIEDQKGLDCECTGLTVLAEQVDRELLGFTRPGSERRSYSRCFVSALRRAFRERLTTGMRGELRPCIACGFCEEVCPAGIMPHLIHKLLYQSELEEVEQARVDLCIGCGMCSFVCPSKIDLRDQFLRAQAAIAKELHVREAQA